MQTQWAFLEAYSPGALLGTMALFQSWLEATMARHMAVELPLLVCIGWLASHVSGTAFARWLEPWNQGGLAALLAVFLISSFWMLPVALDLAVLHGDVSLLKVSSLVLAGMLLGASWKRSTIVVRAFFVLNWVWMTLTAGFLYRDAPGQLCAVYLSDQQAMAGAGLVSVALAVLVLWGWDLYLRGYRAESHG